MLRRVHWCKQPLCSSPKVLTQSDLRIPLHCPHLPSMASEPADSAHGQWSTPGAWLQRAYTIHSGSSQTKFHICPISISTSHWLPLPCPPSFLPPFPLGNTHPWAILLYPSLTLYLKLEFTKESKLRCNLLPSLKSPHVSLKSALGCDLTYLLIGDSDICGKILSPNAISSNSSIHLPWHLVNDSLALIHHIEHNAKIELKHFRAGRIQMMTQDVANTVKGNTETV